MNTAEMRAARLRALEGGSAPAATPSEEAGIDDPASTAAMAIGANLMRSDSSDLTRDYISEDELHEVDQTNP